MARNTSTIYLGYEDEPVTDKNKHLIDYTTNKVGGQPTWPGPEIAVAGCPICGLRRPLVLQIYAPLDGSPFHRMLYLFSCVNAVCSNQSRGWLCVRVQHMERYSPVAAEEAAAAAAASVRAAAAAAAAQSIKWCSGADDWGDDSGDGGGGGGGFGAAADASGGGGAVGGCATEADDEEDANCNEPNGNVVLSKIDNRVSDDEDDTNSLETDPLPVAAALDQLALVDDNDRNANAGALVVGGNGGAIGAVGRLHSPNASAEIEGGEAADELVCIDAPVVPKRDLIALLKQTTAVPMDSGQLQLRGFYVAVEREERTADGGLAGAGGGGGALAEHVRELLLEYQSRDEKLSTSPTSPVASGGSVVEAGGGAESEEKYEKGVPMHGDVMFHNFVSTIQENPGQILRYSRDSLPLLAAALPDQRSPATCANCAGPLLCELQLLPTVIPKLRFAVNGDAAPLEFGNVLVFTCQKSCWDTPDRMRSELVVVQPEI